MHLVASRGQRIIAEKMSSWQQIPNVRSPTGSVDSGVGLSPRAYAYGAYDDISPTSQIFSEGLSPESPTTAGGNDNVAANSKLAWPTLPSDYHQPYPEQLTPDELECLSSGGYSEFDISPSSPEHSPVNNLPPEVTHFEKQLNREEVSGYQKRNYAELTCGKVEASLSIGTITRKQRKRVKQISFEEAHPGIDPCLVPKSGTSKPRQSRKKPKLGHAVGTNGIAANMKPRINTGARVKETARERLNRMRLEMQKDGMAPRQIRPSQSSMQQTQDMKKEASRYGRGEPGVNVPSRYPQSEQGDASHYHKPSRHSVEDILCTPHTPTPHSSPFQQGGDSLDQMVNAALQMDNLRGLIQHIQRASTAANASGQTTLHAIMEKLNQRKEQISPQQIQKVTKLLCDMLPNELDTINYKGETPVYRAALYGNIGALQALVDANADLWIKERSGGEVALHAAIRSKNPEAVRTIITKAKESQTLMAHINCVAHGNGNTPLHNATALRDVDLAVQREIVLSLLSAGADPSRKNHTNAMAHALLPEGLRELQNEMKRLNGRRRQQSLQHNQVLPPARQVDASAYMPPGFHSRYPAFSANFPGHLACPNPFGQASPLAYLPDFQQARTYPGMSTPHFPSQLESFGHHFFPVSSFGPMAEAPPANYRLSHVSDPGPQSPSTVTSEYSDSLDELLDTFGPEVEPNA